jgi:hypothetical protein
MLVRRNSTCRTTPDVQALILCFTGVTGGGLPHLAQSVISLPLHDKLTPDSPLAVVRF